MPGEYGILSLQIDSFPWLSWENSAETGTGMKKKQKETTQKRDNEQTVLTL